MHCHEQQMLNPERAEPHVLLSQPDRVLLTLPQQQGVAVHVLLLLALQDALQAALQVVLQIVLQWLPLPAALG
jgi:hypothetical protein